MTSLRSAGRNTQYAPPPTAAFTYSNHRSMPAQHLHATCAALPGGQRGTRFRTAA